MTTREEDIFIMMFTHYVLIKTDDKMYFVKYTVTSKLESVVVLFGVFLFACFVFGFLNHFWSILKK